MTNVNVLIYHRVAELKEDPQLLAVTPDNFYKQMKYLKDNYHILRFGDVWEQDGVVITFDDGYVDNYIYAYPILKELNIPATIFVSTGNMNTEEEMWWDELERLILAYPPEKDNFDFQDKLFNCAWNTKGEIYRNRFYRAFHWLIYKHSDYHTRSQWIQQLKDWNPDAKRRDIYRTINDEECRIMDGSGLIEIGGHTVGHFSLGKLRKEAQEKEIVNSLRYLKQVLGHDVQTFSYPFGGRADYNQDTIDILKREGIVKCAANVPGIWNNAISDYDIPRNLVRDWDVETFIAGALKMKG